jgi:S-adenosylmethionine synthetase
MFGTGKVPDEKIASLIEEHFDPRSGAIIRDLGLRKPIFLQMATNGILGVMIWICHGRESWVVK